ncbi:MAG: four helix bundle protein [Elusimicrobia bacterium]|nr:four helix bundle protein [Elusimicrobiota bacterium]
MGNSRVEPRHEEYKKLEIYNYSHKLAVEVHKMSLTLPKFEMFEEGSQIRRSSKSVCTNIVEGYCLRNYKQEYLYYLYRAYSECRETIQHLEFLYETGSLKEKPGKLFLEYSGLSKMIYSFINSVEKTHISKK